ncbi:MAG TPA: 3-phosphoshikimate 1-carboxyvinyltransferase [Gaiellaceae bacterium]|nr:3-phosphoshikimate 1-carboxyvinyltransferase [Gaiellaceae bacterium]
MRIAPAAALVGHVRVPGDKSISHRALLVGAVCEGETRIEGWGRSGDTESTLAAVRALGVDVREEDETTLVVRGAALRGLRPPAEPVDCGNAGTLMRLLPGLLAGQEGRFELVGDESLSRRPMERVAEPLRRMGVAIETRDGFPPVVVEGGPVTAIDYRLPVASAQVKSAVLLAGLFGDGRTTVVEPRPTRDHTELLLQAAGAEVIRRPTSASVDPVERLRLERVEVPGDFSSAAPLLVAAAIVPGSDLTLHGVGLNPRRTGLLDVLGRMGARVAVYNRHRAVNEPAGDVEVRASELVATRVSADEVPSLVDELPLVALAMAHARGESVVEGAEELRVKESDRIDATAAALHALGTRVETREDGWRIRGVPARPRGGTIDGADDHRIAMLGAVAGLASREGVELRGAEAVAISFPGFFQLLSQLQEA